MGNIGWLFWSVKLRFTCGATARTSCLCDYTQKKKNNCEIWLGRGIVSCLQRERRANGKTKPVSCESSSWNYVFVFPSPFLTALAFSAVCNSQQLPGEQKVWNVVILSYLTHGATNALSLSLACRQRRENKGGGDVKMLIWQCCRATRMI